MRYRMRIKDGAFYAESKLKHEEALKRTEKWGAVPMLEVENPISENFRGYYFVVIGFLHSLKMYPALAEKSFDYKRGDFKLTDAYHALLKRDFNGIHIQVDVDKVEKVGRSIAVKNGVRFQNYIDRISEYTKENFGIRVPSAEEYKMYRDSFMQDRTGLPFEKWFIEKKGNTSELLSL